MAVAERAPGLHLVDLNPPLEGFRAFVSCWVLRRGGATVLVDPGPSVTAPALMAALHELGVARVDWVLLTHIHLDHAGAAGLVLGRYPEARVLCHPAGIPHLVDPARLWAGSLKVLGKMAEAYGPVAPVPADRIGWSGAVDAGPLRVTAFETPGHAAHHACFRIDEVLFAGEVAGVASPLAGGPYQRPATPPVFRYEPFRASVEAAARAGAEVACLGHHGLTRDPAGFFADALAQLELWLATVEAHLKAGTEPFDDAVFAELRRTDPLIRRFGDLPADVQKRERHFAGNALAGLRGYVEDR
ncbi:MAG: MBL fold metallo-hydrolase [Deferrisomatales bacterium]